MHDKDLSKGPSEERMLAESFYPAELGVLDAVIGLLLMSIVLAGFFSLQASSLAAIRESMAASAGSRQARFWGGAESPPGQCSFNQTGSGRSFLECFKEGNPVSEPAMRLIFLIN